MGGGDRHQGAAVCFFFLCGLGLPYSAGEAEVRDLFNGFDVKSVYLPLASQQRMGQTKGESLQHIMGHSRFTLKRSGPFLFIW